MRPDTTETRAPEPKLSELDLNLLVTLDALLEARSVTATAEHFGVTQSAMSHRLARLRQFFDDPILIPTGDSLVLTHRAQQMREPLRAALANLRDAVVPEAAFDPAKAQRSFTLAGVDMVELLLLPTLLAHLDEEAPGIQVAMAGRQGLVQDALARGRADILIAPGHKAVPGVQMGETAGIRQRKLFDEGFAVMARRGHPRLRNSLTLKRYLAEGHVLVAPEGQPGSIVDVRLAQEGKQRRVAARVAHFLSAPFLVARTDHLLTCPAGLATSVYEELGLSVFKPPISLPSTPIFLYWHERTHKDPGHRWLRELILTLTRGNSANLDGRMLPRRR
ncbi:MAG: LysR family transcriptional regulator [Myxococcota bacterium]